jgi:type III pantothenate kinase
VTPDVVVDIGNTRLKWGICAGGRVAEVLRLPLDDESAWDMSLAKLLPPRSSSRKWAVASVNPPALHRFLGWCSNHGGAVPFERYTDLPIRVNVDEPAKVGLDRLFGCIAARAMSPAGMPAITVDVGTAVTVNLIDADGVFQGGAIFPGPRLMARALHEFTARLPLIDPTEFPTDEFPGKTTTAAIRLGIDAALAGGMFQLVSLTAQRCITPPWLFLTGGGAYLLDGYELDRCSPPDVARLQRCPTLTLEGIRIAAEALP